MRCSVTITTNSLRAGGAEKQRIYLANHLASRGYSVTLRVIQARGELEDLIQPGVRVEMGGATRAVPDFQHWIISGTTNTEVAVASRARIFGRCSRWSIAVHNPVSGSAPPVSRLVTGALSVADDVIALTPNHKQLIEKHWGVRPTHVIPNGIEVVNPDAAHQSVKYDVGFIGRLDVAHKGLDRLVSLIAESRGSGLRFGIAGDGPGSEYLQASINSLACDESVDLLGHVRPEEYIPRCGVMMMLSRWEAQPLVLLEARYHGVRTVCSREVGATSDDYVRIVDGDDSQLILEEVLSLRDAMPPPPDHGVEASVNEMGLSYESVLGARGSRRGRISSLRCYLGRLLVRRGPS